MLSSMHEAFILFLLNYLNHQIHDKDTRYPIDEKISVFLYCLFYSSGKTTKLLKSSPGELLYVAQKLRLMKTCKSGNDDLGSSESFYRTVM